MTADAPEEQFPPARAGGRGRGWYRGDCHMHSVRSHGGELTPEQLAAAARALGLDFVATTEHNTSDMHGAWGQLAGDDLLVILGQEVTTQTGHWLALGIEPGQTIEWRYGIRDGAVDRCVGQVHAAGGLCVAAHPHVSYPEGVFMYPFGVFDVIEVWNGLWRSDLPWNADNGSALAEWGRSLAAGIGNGRWLPAMGNSDAHLRGQLGIPHTVVLAEELSTREVLAGLRAGRSWIAGSTAVRLSLEAFADGLSAGIGERLDTRGAPVVVRVAVDGVPSGSTVSFHTDRGPVHRESLSADEKGLVEWATSAEATGFVRVEVREPGGDAAALTNPVLLT